MERKRITLRRAFVYAELIVLVIAWALAAVVLAALGLSK